MTWLDFDVSAEIEGAALAIVEGYVRAYRGFLSSYVAHGPGGGNPNFVVEIPGPVAKAYSFLEDLHLVKPGEDWSHFVIPRPACEL